MNGINQMRMAVASPEKAGVGGSTPSLATIVFNHLPLPFPRVWFHLVPIQLIMVDAVRGLVAGCAARFSATMAIILPTARRCDSGTNCA